MLSFKFFKPPLQVHIYFSQMFKTSFYVKYNNYIDPLIWFIEIVILFQNIDNPVVGSSNSRISGSA